MKSKIESLENQVKEKQAIIDDLQSIVVTSHPVTSELKVSSQKGTERCISPSSRGSLQQSNASASNVKYSRKMGALKSESKIEVLAVTTVAQKRKRTRSQLPKTLRDSWSRT